MNPDRYTILGIEKPFPWVGLAVLAIGVGGLVAGVWAAAEMFDDHLYGF